MHQLSQGLLRGRGLPSCPLLLCRDPRLGLEEGSQGAGGLTCLGAVLWGLPREGARLTERLALLQEALLVPLHQEGLELLLLLRCQVPQLRVLGQDPLELRPNLTHQWPWDLSQHTWGQRGGTAWLCYRPCFGALEPWGLLLALWGAHRPLTWLRSPRGVPMWLRASGPGALRWGEEGARCSSCPQPWLGGHGAQDPWLRGAQEELLPLPQLSLVFGGLGLTQPCGVGGSLLLPSMQLPPTLAALGGQSATLCSSRLLLGSQDCRSRLHSLTQVQHRGGLTHRPVLRKVLDRGLPLAHPQEALLGCCCPRILLLWGQQCPCLPQLLRQHKPMAQHPRSLRRAQHPLLVGGQQDLPLGCGVAQHCLVLQPWRMPQQAWLLLLLLLGGKLLHQQALLTAHQPRLLRHHGLPHSSRLWGGCWLLLLPQQAGLPYHGCWLHGALSHDARLLHRALCHDTLLLLHGALSHDPCLLHGGLCHNAGLLHRCLCHDPLLLHRGLSHNTRLLHR